MPRSVRLRLGLASHALAIYTVITLAATWPLAGALGSDVAWDLGDSLLNMWILSWDCEQLLAMLGGDFSRAAGFFDANIFYPAPLTLAYSEHLLPQAVQVLPIYAVTRNPILCYNLLFLSTFALSGLGAYLLVRQLTGNALAAFVAGLLFAFAPYRLPQASHLQVLSSQWMPFVLYGISRYFAASGGPEGPPLQAEGEGPPLRTDGDGPPLHTEGAAPPLRTTETRSYVEADLQVRPIQPLLWAAVALAVQGLSCGYYLLYFAPFAAGYAVWEMVARRAWATPRTWLHLAAAGALTTAMTAPFLIPYGLIHDRFEMTRTRAEVTRLSADVHSYATAFIDQPVWGDIMRAFPKAEGDLFPGLIPIVLAILGLAMGRQQTVIPPDPTRWRRLAAGVLVATAAAHLLLAIAAVVERRINVDLGFFSLRLRDVTHVLLQAAVVFTLALAVSPRARQRTARFLADRGFFVVGLIAALWLSLGPAPQTLGRPLDLAAPYRWLYEHVPGFDGLRVPARLAMIVTLMLAILGGYGAAALARRGWGRAVVAAMAALFLLEGTQVPFLVNGLTELRVYRTPEARVYPPHRAPAIYREGLRRIRPAVLAELPLGQPDFDLRAVYYSTTHGGKIINGYSGFFPPHYGRLTLALQQLPRHPELSMDALVALGTTHVVVHEGAYLGNEGKETSDALRTRGAVELYRDGDDVIFQLPR